MDWYTNLIDWLSGSNFASLTGVVGLAAFVKAVIVPFVKWGMAKLGKTVEGVYTIIVVYAFSIIIPIIVNGCMHGFKVATIGGMIYVGIAAATSAIGLQKTIAALKSPGSI